MSIASLSIVNELQVSQKRPVSTEEMAALEERGESLGISKLVMMENAGAFISEYVVTNYLHLEPRRGRLKVLIVAGTGNNGGDAFVAARHLAYYENEIDVTVVIVGEFANIRAKEALTNFNILQKINSIAIEPIASLDQTRLLQNSIENSDLAIVGLFGTGFHGQPRPLAKKVIEMINSSHKFVVSIDVPSGIDSRTGEFITAVKSNVTLTMHAPKRVMLDKPARDICGSIIIGNIGLPF